MEYTIQKIANLAGISTRTLRHYDSIDLLKPMRINSSGYRIYGENEIDKLQQILFFRELGFGLDTIKELISKKDFDPLYALNHHKQKLLEKKKQLDLLIETVDKSIAEREGKIRMTDQEKFAGFKKQMLHENEKQYGTIIREKYGAETVEKSNQKLLNMTEEEYLKVTKLAEDIQVKLAEAKRLGDPASVEAQEVAAMHKRWLSFYWAGYSKEAHRGLAQMYVDDPRFAKYYDAQEPGSAAFLRDAIFIYTGKTK